MSGLYSVGWLIVDAVKGHVGVNHSLMVFDTYREAREQLEEGERIVRCKVEWDPEAPSPFARFGRRKRPNADSGAPATRGEDQHG